MIEREILPHIATKEIGIVAPYRDQVKLLNSRLGKNGYLIDTVHKFQGKEKDNIIISTVVNKVRLDEDNDNIDFLNDPNLLNVAISRAKNKLHIVISEELMKQSGAILSDFSRYNKYFCEDSKIEKTQVYSVLDLMYQDYSPVLESFRRKMIKISEFASENIIATLVKEICEEKKFGIFGFLAHYPLRKLVRSENVLDDGDRKFLLNPNTHCDFVIFDKLDKSIKMVIEVDGMQHSAGVQKVRDERKDGILNNSGIPILRIKTTSSNCKERIEDILRYKPQENKTLVKI